MLTDDDIADAAHALQQERIEDMGGVDTDWFEMMAKAAMMKYRSWDIEKQRAEDAKQRAEAEQPPAPARKPWPTEMTKRVVAEADKIEPPQPVTPSRVGQWFRDPNDPSNIYGPIVRSIGPKHETAVDGGWLSEQFIAAGEVLRIPPKLHGMDVDVDECREPAAGEIHYNLYGLLAKTQPNLDPKFGRLRWISKAQPATSTMHPSAKWRHMPETPAKTWPVGPCTARAVESAVAACWVVEDADGCRVTMGGLRQEVAEAIALALSWTPRAAAWMRTDRARFPLAQHPGSCLHELDALLAEVDAAGFEL